MKIFTVVTIFFLTTSSMFAQLSFNANAAGNILPALCITKATGILADLSFGDIVPGATNAASVAITADAAGTRSNGDGNATLVTSNIGHSAKFNIAGIQGTTVNLALSQAEITLSDGSGHTMGCTLVLSSSTSEITGGSAIVYVGGTLFIAANQAVGHYTQMFNLTAQY